MIFKARGSIAIAIAAVFLVGCDSPHVQMVKGGTLSMCEGSTVGEMAEGWFGESKWDSGKAEDGTEFVNVGGRMTYLDKPVEGMIQFEVTDSESFQYRAFEINGVPQNALFAMGLLRNMCDEAS